MMKTLPKTEKSLVLRTDFSNEAAWESVCAAIQQPVGDFQAHVAFFSAPEFDGITPDQLLLLAPGDWDRSFIFVVDQLTLSDPENPILVIDLQDEPGRTFRVIPSEMWGVENNLSLANMDFAEFADATDEDGVFRGFSEI